MRGVMKRFALLFGILICISHVSFLDALTLSGMQQYAESVPEYVEAENWLNPDFSEFYKGNKPGFGRRFLNWFGFGYKGWNARAFKKTLLSLTKKRELNGQVGDFIQKYKTMPGDHVLAWIDLFGAFHSLIRDLVELKNKGIINDDLKIMKDNYLFVFNGNLINHSSYVLETLTVVMQLLAVNPQQVVYVRGTQEDKQEWHSYALARELKIRAAHLSHEMIPLNKNVTKFFNTLPLGLFLPQVSEKEINVVLIANNEYSRAGFTPKNFAGFLEDEKAERISSFKLSNKAMSKKEVHVKALITGEDRSVTYHQTQGLTMLGMQREALQWLVFSSPTSRNRRLYEFFYDAFAEIYVADQMSDWTISLYNQDVRKLLGFKKSVTYDLLTGQRVREGVKKVKKKVAKKEEKGLGKKDSMLPVKEEEKSEPGDVQEKEAVVLGSTIDLSKSASMIGKDVRDGLDLAFGRAVQMGGVNSYLPRIIIRDDGYTPSKSRALVEDFLNKSNISIFLNSVGSPTTESYLDLIQAGKALVLFPYTGAPIFRKPELKYLAHMRIGYVDEGRALADYAIDSLNARKVAIFYQNDAFGLGALQGAMEVLDARGFKDVVKVPYERNDVQFELQAKKIEQSDPDTIFFFAVTPAARSLVRQLGVSFLRGKNLIGMSVYDEAFEQFLESKGLRFVMVRVVPNPRTSDLEIVKEYRDAAKASNHVPNFNALEAFINANIFFDIIKRIKPPLTKEKIIEEIEKIKNYNFKGIELDFDPNSRELVRTLWIDTGDGPWIKKEVRPASDQKKKAQEKEQLAVPASDTEKKKEQPKSVEDKKQPLRFGSVIDLSKGVKQQGIAVKHGIELRLQEAHDADDNLIERVIVVDDSYTPSITRKEVEGFLRQDIDSLLAPVGSPTLESYLDLVKEGKVLVLFPITGAPLFRKPDLKYIAHIRPSYKTEGKLLAEYALETIKARKGVLFYQDDAFGKGVLDGARKVLQERGITNWIEVPYQRNDVNFKKQVDKITQYDPDTILFFSTTTAASGLIRQMGVQNVLGKQLLANSDFGEERFLVFVRDKGLKLVYLNVVPNPETSNLVIVKQFREAAKKQGIALDTFSLESYIATDFLLDIVQKIKGVVTKEKIIDAIEKIKNYTYKGLHFDFNPETRTLSSTFWMSTGTPNWKEIAIKHNKEDES